MTMRRGNIDELANVSGVTAMKEGEESGIEL
jgi:hypothetical protein